MTAIVSQIEKQKITSAHWTLFHLLLGDAIGGTVSTLMSTYLRRLSEICI